MKYLVIQIFVLVTTFISVNVSAAESAGVPIGNGQLYPQLDIKLQHDDNLLRANTGEIDTFVSIFSPQLLYQIESNKSLMLFEYVMDTAEHFSSHNDDYVDNRARAEFEYEPTSRIFTAVRGEFVDTRDPRGTGASEGAQVAILSPDFYHSFGVLGEMRYGAKTAKGRFEFDVGYKDKNYDTNRQTTFVRDRDDFYGSARFLYRILPKTNLLFETRAINFNYEQDAVGTAGLDSTTFKYLAGVTWDATYKTTGYAKLGLIEKKFDSSARADGDALLWELGVEWQPRTYSTFSLSTQRDFTETNGIGDFIEENSVNAGWKHEWPGNLISSINYTFSRNDYASLREDDKNTLSLKLDYKMRRWFTVGVGYTYDERDSNNSNFNYERNIFELTAVITL